MIDTEKELENFFKAPWSEFRRTEFDSSKKDFTENDMFNAYERGRRTTANTFSYMFHISVFNKWLKGWKLTGKDIA